MDRYSARINLMGTTQRERELNRLKQSILKDSQASLSYKTVSIDGVESHLMIDSSTSNPHIKEIKSLSNATFSVGNYVVWSGSTWLVTKADIDDEVYVDGQMQLCNYTLKFQSPLGTILSYPCIDESSNGVGINETDTINTLNGVKRIKLPFDENTKLIDYDDRFFTSRSKPITSKVTNINDTEFSFGDKGLIVFTMEADSAYNPQTDRFDLGVCNYFEPVVAPPTPDPTVPTEIVTITSDATNNQVILGITHTFSATFKNELGQDVSNVVAQYSVDNTYGGKVVLVDNGDKTATITVGNFGDTELCTKQLTLRCYDSIHGFESTILLTIVGMY